MKINPTKIKAKFYIDEISATSGSLRVNIGLNDELKEHILFKHVRAFLHFKESDMYAELESLTLEPVVISESSSGGVFQVTGSPITESIFKETLSEEGPQFYLVLTPDECIEVISFSPPLVEGNVDEK